MDQRKKKLAINRYEEKKIKLIIFKTPTSQTWMFNFRDKKKKQNNKRSTQWQKEKNGKNRKRSNSHSKEKSVRWFKETAVIMKWRNLRDDSRIMIKSTLKCISAKELQKEIYKRRTHARECHQTHSLSLTHTYTYTNWNERARQERTKIQVKIDLTKINKT